LLSSRGAFELNSTWTQGDKVGRKFATWALKKLKQPKRRFLHRNLAKYGLCQCFANDWKTLCISVTSGHPRWARFLSKTNLSQDRILKIVSCVHCRNGNNYVRIRVNNICKPSNLYMERKKHFLMNVISSAEQIWVG
jgi:hypothetical protein